MIKRLLQLTLGAFLTSAGVSHLDSNRQEFLAQVPTYLPIDPDFVVVASGLVEIALGIALITTTFFLTFLTICLIRRLVRRLPDRS